MIRIITKKRYEQLLIAEQEIAKLTDRDVRGKFTKNNLVCTKCRIIYSDNKLIKCEKCKRVLKVITPTEETGLLLKHTYIRR